MTEKSTPVFLVFIAKFPTDYEGELKFASFSKEKATNVANSFAEIFPSAEINCLEIELDTVLEERIGRKCSKMKPSTLT